MSRFRSDLEESDMAEELGSPAPVPGKRPNPGSKVVKEEQTDSKRGRGRQAAAPEDEALTERETKKQRISAGRAAKAKSKGGKRYCPPCQKNLALQFFEWDLN